ncbi:hypothetical protein niasHT_013397 [Heterodera trifolii]|uniref:Major facilitator superfamily (MFS) profile domain-containing protein n=1 Tax=Heterodera trifolii TaxID=157864 RepID=A0ABD2LDA2_9BILA
MVSFSCPSSADAQKTPRAQKRRLPPLSLFLCSLLVAFGVPFHYGFQLTLISPVQRVMVQFINESVHSHYSVRLDRYDAEAVWGATVASFFAGAIPGALLTQFVADNFGRKFGIVLSNAAIAFCALLLSVSKFLNSIELFVASRFILGFFVTIGIGISSVFLTECSPVQCRGGIGMITGIMIQFGCIVGALLAMPELLGDQSHWWLLFLLEALVLIAVTVTMLTLYESPNFLLFHDQHDKAVDAAKFYWGQNKSANAILNELRAEQITRSNSMGMLEILRQKKSISTAKGFWIGIFLSICMAFCGIIVIDAYIVEVLQQTMNFSALSSSFVYIGIQIFGLFSIIFASLLVDRIGRRPLLFISISLLLFANLVISLILYLHGQSLFVNIALVLVVVLHSSAMCCGVFPLSFFVANEIVAQNARSSVQGWSKMVEAISRSIVLSAYLPVRNKIGDGPAYALFFLPPLAAIGIYLYGALPETKNRTMAEIENKIAEIMAQKSKHREEKRDAKTNS